MHQTRNKIISEIILQNKLPNYRQNQIFQAIYKENIKSYSEISNLPKNLRQQLEINLGLVLTLKPITQSQDTQAQKMLFETRDGEKIEAVRMTFLPNKQRPYKHNALCISSQSGCAMGCAFCATGALGFRKNLTEDEIVDQYLYFRQNGEDIETIFFSGMGEPFANPNLWEALNIFTYETMIGLSPRRLSISTVGIVPGIERLTKEFPQVNLAISLHTPFNEQREELMPITKQYSINQVFHALDNHVQVTNRKVFVAYTLLGGINDSEDHARALATLIRKRGNKAYLYHVNLIRYHPTGKESRQVSEEKLRKFKEILDIRHIQNTIRQDFGINIEGACGQLAAKEC